MGLWGGIFLSMVLVLGALISKYEESVVVEWYVAKWVECGFMAVV